MRLNDIYFAYSYERVTPGGAIIRFLITTKLYAGVNDISSQKCKIF